MNLSHTGGSALWDGAPEGSPRHLTTLHGFTHARRPTGTAIVIRYTCRISEPCTAMHAQLPRHICTYVVHVHVGAGAGAPQRPRAEEAPTGVCAARARGVPENFLGTRNRSQQRGGRPRAPRPNLPSRESRVRARGPGILWARPRARLARLRTSLLLPRYIVFSVGGIRCDAARFYNHTRGRAMCTVSH